MAYTTTWDSSFEGSPANTDNISEGAERIRVLKVAISERMAKDHYFNTSGTDADHGEHVVVTLREEASAPSAVANKGKLYALDSGSVTELYYRDSAGDATRITDNGRLYVRAIWDNDLDTGIQVEESSDEDIVRVDAAGDQIVYVNTNGLYTNDGKNLYIHANSALLSDTISERTAATGVTIDGLLIKDGVVGTNGVDTTSIQKECITVSKVEDELFLVGSIGCRMALTYVSSYTEFGVLPFKCPTGPDKIHVRIDGVKAAGGSCHIVVKLKNSSFSTVSTSDEVYFDTSRAWQEFTDIDISGLTPGSWYGLHFEYDGAGTFYGASAWWKD